MPLLSQWVRQRPWLAAGLLGATGGFAGIAGGMVAAASAIGAITLGGVSS